MLTVIVFGCFFIIFCLFVWLEYLQYQFQRQRLQEAKEKGALAIERYEMSKKNHNVDVVKDMLQKIKAKELNKDLSDSHLNDDDPLGKVS